MSLSLTHAMPPKLREVSLLDLLGNFYVITLYFGQALGIEFGIHSKCTLEAQGRWLDYSILEDESQLKDGDPEREILFMQPADEPQKTERWGPWRTEGCLRMSTDEIEDSPTLLEKVCRMIILKTLS